MKKHDKKRRRRKARDAQAIAERGRPLPERTVHLEGGITVVHADYAWPALSTDTWPRARKG